MEIDVDQTEYNGLSVTWDPHLYRVLDSTLIGSLFRSRLTPDPSIQPFMGKVSGGAEVEFVYKWGDDEGPSWRGSASGHIEDESGNQMTVSGQVEDDGSGEFSVSVKHEDK